MTLPELIACAALLCVAAAAVADMWRFEIPDTLSVALIAGGIGYGLSVPGFAWVPHLLAPVLVFAAGLFVFSRGWLGGGDIKLLTAASLWTGLDGVPMLIVGTSLAGGVLAIVLIGLRGGVARAGVSAAALPRLLHTDAPLPYAVAIFAACLWWAQAAWPIA